MYLSPIFYRARKRCGPLLTTALLLLCAATAFADPVPIADQHPLAAPHWSLRPESAILQPDGALYFATTALWSNTYNAKGGYVVDAETVNGDFEIEYGLTKNWEIEVVVPVLHRGSGMLDSLIKEWDSVIGFPNERRERAEDDRFEIAGDTESDEEFSWEKSGASLGAIPVTLRYGVRQDELAYAVFGSIQLPTGRSTFAAESVDGAFGVLVDYGLDNELISNAVIHGGGAVSYWNDLSIDGVEYLPWHFDGFAGVSIPFWEHFSLYGGLLYRTQVTDNLAKTPNELLYLDVAVTADLGRSWKVTGFFRENPLYSSRSTDITVGARVEILTDWCQ